MYTVESVLHLRRVVLGVPSAPPCRRLLEALQEHVCLPHDPRETGGGGRSGGQPVLPDGAWGRAPRVVEGSARAQHSRIPAPTLALFLLCLLRQLSTGRTDLGVLCRPCEVLCAPAPHTGMQSQGSKKNGHCVMNSGEVPAQDRLSHWISNIHGDKIEKNLLLFIFWEGGGALPPPWTCKPRFGLHS